MPNICIICGEDCGAMKCSVCEIEICYDCVRTSLNNEPVCPDCYYQERD